MTYRRFPPEPAYPALQTLEQFLHMLDEHQQDGLEWDNNLIANLLHRLVGQELEITSNLPEYFTALGEPPVNSGCMKLVEVYLESGYVCALGDEGWALLVTNDGLSIKAIVK